MLKAFLISNTVLITLVISFIALAAASPLNVKDKTIVITSQTLVADNKNNTVTFEGLVKATSGDITIHSDKMTVLYNNTDSKVTKIHATGNVMVYKEERAIFSKEATYLGDEEKIIFTGNPRAVEGQNVITGTKIIYFFKDDRAIVEGSKVVLQNKKGQI